LYYTIAKASTATEEEILKQS